MVKKTKAIINSGTGLFPLAWIASEVSKQNNLTKLIVAAYPTKIIVDTFFRIDFFKRTFKRLLGRKLEINEDLLEISWGSEFFYQLAHKIRGKKRFKFFYDLVSYFSHLFIEFAACKIIKNVSNDTKIYHFRAGFGGNSLKLAKEKKLITICHHTQAHPLTFEYLVKNRGRKPNNSNIRLAKDKLSIIWKKILSDIEKADYVLIESEFQLETFKWVGFDLEKIISINHPGIDPYFRSIIPEKKLHNNQKPKILFAGTLNRIKGADELMGLIENTNALDYELNIAGQIDSSAQIKYKKLIENSKVNVLGVLTRSELAKQMCRNDILILLSYAEGSPRVVLEAMGCGCIIFTCPNSGTPIKELQNGWLSEAGNLVKIEKDFRKMLLSKHLWSEIKSRNIKLSIDYFTPNKYLKELNNLYNKISI